MSARDIGAGAIEQVDREEVGRQDCLGLSVQELRPRRPFAPRRRWDPSGDQDLSHRRRRHENAEASEFTVVASQGVYAASPEPVSLALFALGLMAGLLFRRRLSAP